MEFRSLEGEHRQRNEREKADYQTVQKTGAYFCKDGRIWESRAEERDVIPRRHRHLRVKR